MSLRFERFGLFSAPEFVHVLDETLRIRRADHVLPVAGRQYHRFASIRAEEQEVAKLGVPEFSCVAEYIR